MKDIDKYVVERWASKWQKLGSKLNIEEHLIRNIECDHPNDCEGCCRIMLSKWLEETAHATWDMLIRALDEISDNVTGLYSIYGYLCDTDELHVVTFQKGQSHIHSLIIMS